MLVFVFVLGEVGLDFEAEAACNRCEPAHVSSGLVDF